MEGKEKLLFTLGLATALSYTGQLFFRSSGVSLFHRILANPDARAFLGVFFSGGPQRASAAAFIIELRFSGETLAQRFFAPFRPRALCRLLAGFSLDKSRV